MSQQNWIPVGSFAEAARITPQAARAALRAAQSGRPWRGRRLVVRRQLGRGGAGGLSHQVAADCLPDDVRMRLEGRAMGAAPSPLVITPHDARTPAKLSAVEEVLPHTPGSQARRLAAERAARAHVVTARTIYRWLARYERDGVRGLRRARPANRGKRRVWVSRDFDRAYLAADLPEVGLRDIASQLDRTLKGLWASRAEQAGATEIRRLAEFVLTESCEQRGVQLPRAAMRLSRRRAGAPSASRTSALAH